MSPLLPLRDPGVLPPPAEGHRGVRRAEDGVFPEPEGGGKRHAVLPAQRTEPGTLRISQHIHMITWEGRCR